MDFPKLLEALLVDERGHTPENARRLVSSFPLIVTNGIMRGNHTLRATALALEMKDEEAEAATPSPAQ